MPDDNQPSIVLSAIDSTKAAFQSVTNSVNEMRTQVTGASSSVSGAFESMKGTIESVRNVMLGLGSAMMAGAMFKEVIGSSIEFTEQTHSLAMALGMTHDQATTMNIALKEIGVSSDEYIGMAQKMDRQLRTHSDLFDMLGIKTKDSSGHLLDQQEIMQNALTVMQSYAAGTDRNMVSQALFGRSSQDAAELLRLNADEMEHAKQIQEQLSLSVGENGVEQLHKYQQATADVKLAFTSVSTVVTGELMPIIMDLSKTILSNAVPAVSVLRIAYETVKHAVESVVSIIQEAVTVIAASSAVIYDAVTGNWSNIKNDTQAYHEQMSEIVKKSAQDDINSVNAIDAAYDALFKKKQQGGAADKPGGGAAKLSPEQLEALSGKGKGTGNEPAEKSRMGEWEEEYQEGYLRDEAAHGTYLKKKTSDELAYWDNVLSTQKLTGTETEAIARKLTGLQMQLYKEDYDAASAAAKEKADIAKIRAEEEYDAAKASIAAKKEQLQTMQAMGVVTKDQELALLKNYTEQEYGLEMKALTDQLEALQTETSAYEEMYRKILTLAQKHDQDIKKLDDQKQLAALQNERQLQSSITGIFSQSLTSMENRQKSFSETIASITRNMLNSGLTQIFNDLVAKWAAMELQKVGITQMYDNLLIALGLKTATENVIIKKAEQKAEATSDAPAAAAGAYKAVVGIPVIGPALAPVAAATAFAAVEGFASGGYDIPSSINPIVQTHASEMILPADLSNRIRSMTGQPQGGSSMLNIKGIKADEFLSGGQVKDMIMQLVRNGHLKAAHFS